MLHFYLSQQKKESSMSIVSSFFCLPFNPSGHRIKACAPDPSWPDPDNNIRSRVSSFEVAPAPAIFFLEWEHNYFIFLTVNELSKRTCFNTCVITYSSYFNFYSRKNSSKRLCTIKFIHFAWIIKLKLELEPGQKDGSETLLRRLPDCQYYTILFWPKP